MIVEIEEFSLRNIIPQFREFNRAVKNNRARLEPYFWWPDVGAVSRLRFIMSGILAEKFTRIFHDLPYNKKFIIRANGKFAGAVGLDNVAPNAYRSELWIFVTQDYAGKHIASNAVKLIEKFATDKSVKNIYAMVDQKNLNSQHMLAANDYKFEQKILNLWRNSWEMRWNKQIVTKSIEK